MTEERRRPTLDAIFRPKNIAVVGASKKVGKIGRELVRNLFGYEFEGTIFPVNVQERFISSTKCYESLAAIPDPVDMAVISVPRARVRAALEDCVAKGVRGLVIITAGFKETGEAGALEERELLELVRAGGMIAVGPNCMGVINTDPAVRMNATFGPQQVLPGNVSFLSQSGALGVVLIEQATEIGLGLRMFVSQGNRMDASTDQFLEYWHRDPGTEVILLYIESFGAPRTFPRLARQVAREKPVVVLKSGRTAAGARAASSHTGALAGADAAYDAFFHQTGVYRVSSIEELFDVGKAFAYQRPSRGDGVAILTNAGGPAIMAADACASLGLRLPDLGEATRERLRAALPPEAATQNPVDMIASATPATYRACMNALLGDPAVDALLVVFVAPPTMDPSATLEAIAEVAGSCDRTVVVCLMGRLEQLGHTEALRARRVPAYVYPESAVRALAALVHRGQWLRKPQGEVLDAAVDRNAARAVVEAAALRGGGYLDDAGVQALLAAYGIPLASARRCPTEDAAVAAAAELGLPVVMKVSCPGVVHKSDAGGVFLGLRSELEVRGAYHRIRSAVAPRLPCADDFQVLVQEQIEGGQEIIIGMTSDPNFGPLIMCGIGGIYVEVLKDVVFRLCPVTEPDADEMIRELRGFPLLTGVRGGEPADLGFLREMLQRVSLLVSDCPEIAELDINPFKVFSARARCVAVDARVRITAPTPPPGP
ncbi:MAG: acetate--CoA ligase family protein [Deltaproteobacteria bacterium]|nr:acetate--CoA ligase family protein [Deltaproteobacteria bacterium]